MKQRPDNRGEMYVVRDMRTNECAAQDVVPLDHLAHLTMRALQVSVAVIVVDGGANRWTQRQVGVAVDGACLTVADRDQSSLAALANPVTAETEGFAFYVATPLRDPLGVRIGTLAVLDERLRSVSEDDLTTLREMAGVIERLA